MRVLQLGQIIPEACLVGRRHEWTTAGDEEDFFSIFKHYAGFHAVVIDTDFNHASVSRLFQRQRGTAIVALTSIPSAEERIILLDHGADDVMRKPFHLDELEARISAIVRRSKGEEHKVLKVNGLVIDLVDQIVTHNGRRVKLTHKEYLFFEAVVLRKSGLTTKDHIMYCLYGDGRDVHPKIVDVYLCKIRNKFEDIGCRRDLLETVWGQGVRLNPEEEVMPHAA